MFFLHFLREKSLKNTNRPIKVQFLHYLFKFKQLKIKNNQKQKKKLYCKIR